MPPSPDFVLTECDDDVITITINRPDAFNALNRAALEALHEAVKAVPAMDPPPRVLILTGAGETAFSGGADPTELLASEPEDGRYLSRIGQETCRLLDRMPVVTIAAVNGLAAGGGLELSLACDLVVASEATVFIQIEASAGVVPGWGGTWRLARRVGPMRARLMALTGRPIDAATGAAWGLALEVVPGDALMPRAQEIAGWVLAAAPDAVRATKRMLTETAELSLDAANAQEREAFALTLGTPEMVAAMGLALAGIEKIFAPPESERTNNL